ncbi:MAG: VOC family protein [Actinomycetota bacterium]|nr:VOC family protein [Actinomycetota bacterium]
MNHGEHHYFVLRTADLVASSEFFAELLGWEIDGGELTNVAFFGAITEDFDRAIWVHVEDCDAACAEVVELGGSHDPILDQQSGRNATCRDDQGNTFHIGTLIPEYQDYPHPDPLPEGELAYFTVPVGDPERAVAFYGSLFGWTFDPPGGAVRAEYRHCTNGSLPFGFVSDGDVTPAFYFRVADAAGAGEVVTKLGGRAGQVVDSESGISLIGSVDPTGVHFDLWQPAPGFA